MSWPEQIPEVHFALPAEGWEHHGWTGVTQVQPQLLQAVSRFQTLTEGGALQLPNT